ncbi:MAG: polysaccharide deacetylase family protein [Planctomycetales bacterium]|nr:polysaccharide deacetylase family protein [Planctomycetales bacterium]
MAALQGLRGLDRQSAPRVHILVMHHVFPDERENFRTLLQSLSRRYRFISYGQAVERILAGQVDDEYLTLSFDDGLKCCVDAAEIMQEFGATGCFFVCPPLIGETNSAAIGRFCQERLRLPPVQFMTWDDVERLRNHGHEIGGHTMGHVDLGRVPVSQAMHEIGRSYDQLLRRVGEAKHFAWPYGRFHHICPEAASHVFDVGYISCASAERGAHAGGPSVAPRQVCLRRDTIEARWPLSHIQYFLGRSACNALQSKDTWPAEWHPNGRAAA